MLSNVQTRELGPEIVVVALTGKITAGSDTRRIETLVRDLLEQNKKKLIFDLSDVSYVDSTGMGTIAYCFAAVKRAGGGFRVAGADGKVRNLMKITRLDTVLEFYPSVAAASENFVVAEKPGEQGPW